MTNTQIKKMLELLNTNKLEELKNELTHELLAGTDKTKANLFMAVKNYLKQMDNSRPVLKTINHKNGKQFICNGTTAFIFDEYKTELDELPNTTNEDDCLNIFIIIATNLTYETLSDDDKLILKNIKKYTSYYKTKNGTDDNMISIYWNNHYFDVKVLTSVANIIGNKIDELQVAEFENKLQVKISDITGVVMPLNQRVMGDDETIKIYNTTASFIAELKGH